MNLVVDIGNTRTKLAVFQSGLLLFNDSVSDLTLEILKTLSDEYPKLDRAILSTVKDYQPESRSFLQNNFRQFIELSHETPVPIKNYYLTPHTLGLDRLAAVVGAVSMLPEYNLLVIDAGTAITYDIVTNNREYLGGNISPGLETRFRSLHHFTGRLPLIEKKDNFKGLGTDTESAIRAGVQSGMIFEIDQTINYFNKDYQNLKIIITGGDAEFIEGKLKNAIFVQPFLSLIGLNQILIFNETNAC